MSMEHEANKHAPAPPKARSKLRHWRWVVPMICLIVAGAAAFYFIQERSDKPSVLSAYQQKVDFPLYFPVDLPTEFSVDPSTVSQGEGVILYQIKHTSGDKITVSLQKKPEGFDFEEFYRETLKSPTSRLIPLGKVTHGMINRGSLASIETEQTWILINSLSPLEYDHLKPIIESLQQVN